jgi:hypothetical protein
MRAAPRQEIDMKKSLRKLTLYRETLVALEDSRRVVGGAWVKTVDATACVTNCAGCYGTALSNCC